MEKSSQETKENNEAEDLPVEPRKSSKASFQSTSKTKSAECEDKSPTTPPPIVGRQTTVVIKHEKKKKYDGSLLRLFKSSFFNVHLLITHLLRSKNEGTIDYLVNQLYNEDLEDIDFYMPQLCYLALNGIGRQSIIKFLLDMTPMYPNFGLKAMLYIFSYSQDEGSCLRENASEFSNIIETVIVNNEVPLKYRTKTAEDQGTTDPFKYMDKIHRDKYKNEQLRFFEVLKNTSLKLKNIEVEKRNNTLKLKLNEINRWIIKDLRQWNIEHDTDYEVKFHGIMIPLYEGDDLDPLIIVNLVEDRARCFNTNKRAPIMVVFETINFSEAKARKTDLSDIADEVYAVFEEKYSETKASKKKNMFEVNNELKTELDVENNENTNEIVIENDDLAKNKIEKQPTIDPDAMFNNPFENSDEESKQFEPNFPDNDGSFNADFANDPAFKSFDKFVKFVKVEERLWENEAADDGDDPSDYGSDNDSVTSAIYTFEYGKNLKRRKKSIFGKEQLSKLRKRNRSVEDTLYKPKYHKIPRNIRKLRKALHKNLVDESPKPGLQESDNIDFDAKRSSQSDDFTKADTGKDYPQRDSILSLDKNLPSQEEIETLLEGMKDPFGVDWKIVEKNQK